MFDIFSCSNWSRDLTIQDGYGEYLAYPKSGTLTQAQFEQFQEITKRSKETYPESIDRILAVSKNCFKSIENTFGITLPQVPLSARNYWIQYQLYESNCPVRAFFLPRTLYDILTTHAIQKNNDWQEELKKYSIPKIDAVDEHTIPAEPFARISKELAFSINQHAITELQVRNPRLQFTLNDLEAWTMASFTHSPWYAGNWKVNMDHLDPKAEKFPNILRNTIQLECSVHPTSTLLYRGSKLKQDATEDKGSAESHSLSYGTSLFAGDKAEHRYRGATPWIYCIQSDNDCIALEIQEKEKHPFFIPRKELQMLSQGELFHARTKVPEAAIKSRSISGTYFCKSHENMNLDFLQFPGSKQELSDLWKSFHDKAIILNKK